MNEILWCDHSNETSIFDQQSFEFVAKFYGVTISMKVYSHVALFSFLQFESFME